MEWSNKTAIEFLDMYENEPVIWNAFQPLHKNRNEVFDAWNRIQQKLTTDYSVSELKKKKEPLMARFRQCLAKVKESSKSGACAHNMYKPIWFAYEKMAALLKNKDQPKETINSVQIESQLDTTNDTEDGNADEGDVESGQEQNINLSVPNDAEIAVNNAKALRTSAGEIDTFKAPRQKKRKTPIDDIESAKSCYENFNIIY